MKNDEEEIDVYDPRNKLMSRDENSATSSTDTEEESVIDSDDEGMLGDTQVCK